MESNAHALILDGTLEFVYTNAHSISRESSRMTGEDILVELTIMGFRILHIFIVIVAMTKVACADSPVFVCFERLSEIQARVTFSDNSKFQVIPKGGLDNQIDWFTEKTVAVGETIVSKGIQSQDYWEIISLTGPKLKARHYGFMKGIGTFDRSEDIPFCKGGA